MKKSLIFNLGGNVCYIDEDAVGVLQEYLNELRTHFGETPSTDEVMNDIEARLWEIFSERRRYGMQSATLQDVNEAIAMLGKAEDFGSIADNDVPEQNGETESSAAENENPAQNTKSAKKRSLFNNRKLYRDKQNSVFGGVASGLSVFFGINVIWIRLALILLFCFTGCGLFLYIILWACVPRAMTTSQKLEMQGIEPSVENIHRYVAEQGIKGVMPQKRRFGCLPFFIFGCLTVIISLGIMLLILWSFPYTLSESEWRYVFFSNWFEVMTMLLYVFGLILLGGLPLFWICRAVNSPQLKISDKTAIIFLIIWVAALAFIIFSHEYIVNAIVFR